MEAATGTRELPAGTMLDDKYRIERLLAAGGMGEVYVGTHTRLRKRVAIKVLNPQLSTPAMVERFHREAITASQIGHEGIAQVTDIGTSLQGEPFLVMEYLEGESLAARIRASAPLPVEIACELGCAILSPLAAAHGAGIVHRDLKPDNVFLVRQSRSEVVKLLDFGISRATGLEGEFRLTTTGLVLGTPYYMSPEQARGDTDVTPAADLYAFGVILYEMLVGAVPINADNYNQLMYRVMTGEFLPPRQHRPDLPVELDQLILHAMARDPAQRPASAAELERELLAFCRPTFREHTIERISASTMPPPPLTRGSAPVWSNTPPELGTDRTLLAPPPGMAPASEPTVPLRAATRSRLPWVLGGIGAVAAVAIAAVVLMREGGDAIGPSTGSATTSAPAPSTPTATPGTPTAPATPSAATTADSHGPATAPPTAPTTPIAPTAPAMITLRFAVEPGKAVITVDGKRVGGTELTAPRDEAMHALEITAPGHETHAEQIKFDESQRLVVQLKPTRRRNVQRPPRLRNGGNNRRDKIDRIDTSSPYQ